MKQYILLALFALGTILLSNSCTEELADNSSRGEEGIPVTLSLSYVPNTPDVITRAGESQDAYQNRIFNISVFAFNAAGKQIGYAEQSFEDGKDVSGVQSISLETLSGDNYIYALANLGASSFNTEGLKEELKKCNRENFLNKTISLAENPSVSLVDGYFLMSGVFSVKGSDNEGLINIGVNDTKLEGSIKLCRLMASVTFNVSKSDGSGSKCTSFIPKKWQIKDVPSSTKLFQQDDDDSFSVFSSQEYPFSVNQTSITFYMTENRKMKNVSNFKDRYSNKPENSTYLVLQGYYSGFADKYDENNSLSSSNAPVEGNVIYYIPLGDINNSAWGNYETSRNTKYTYNISVAGVDDIVIEVIKQTVDDNQDGDLIYLDGTQPVKKFDAHYGACLLTFNQSEISSKGLGGYRVKTPFTENKFVSSEIEGIVDDSWVKFMVNESNGSSYSNLLQKYPGDDDVALLSIQELLNLVKVGEAFKEGELKVTAFINEYYYEGENWWEFANKSNREMMILCKTTEFKPGNSSLTDAAYVLSQRSIQTYFVTNGNATYAVGLEWSNETPISNKGNQYGTPLATSNNSKTDGRQNMLEEINIGTTKWDNGFPYFTDVTYEIPDNVSPNGSYKAYNACMSRNRNSNSFTDVVKPEDVKWFLPTIRQYQDIVMGANGYDPEVALYTNKDKNYAIHYYSNTYKNPDNRGNGGDVLWAEEGASFSDGGEYRNGYNYPKNLRHAVRCMRYLGKVDAGGSVPQYVSGKNSGQFAAGKECMQITLDLLNPLCLRPFADNTLTAHTEVSENNMPYKSFLVYPEEKRGGKWNDVNNSPSSYCPSGWRVPNQRELSLIAMVYSNYTNFSDTSHGLVTRTGYSLGTNPLYKNPSYGYVYSNSGMGLSSSNNNVGGYIRCVKDVK